MIEDGLIIKPNYEDVNYYLREGKMTNITDDIQQIADIIKNNMSDGMVVKNIIAFMNRNVARLNNAYSDERKFKRTAQEILESKERTGCADSATLFRAISIACGIPTMQIIGMSKENYKSGGHFYSGVYLRDVEGKKKWHILDSDQSVQNMENVRLDIKKDIYDRNIGRDYAFAYTLDYREIDIDGKTIDSIENMNKISSIVHDMCDKKDMEEIYSR